MKLLILDVGTYFVKALYVEKKHKKVSFLDKIIMSINRDPALSKLEQITNVLKSIKELKDFMPDKILVIFPSEKTTNRFINLPFRDNKRISLTLPLELEEQLPFELDDIVFNWQTIETQGRTSKLLVSIANKTDISLFIDALQSAGFDPDILTTGVDALLGFVQDISLGSKSVEIELNNENVIDTQYSSYAIIEMGNVKTNIIIAKKGITQLVRTINYGGEHITKTIMEKYQLTFDDAENFKTSSGVVLSDENQDGYPEDQVRFSQLIRETVDIIVRDINQTVSSYKASFKEPINVAYIVGGGWLINNLKEYVENELKIELQVLDLKSAIDISCICDNKEEEAFFSPSISLLNSFLKTSNWKGFNYRKGEYSKNNEAEGFLQLTQSFKPTIKVMLYGLFVFFVYAILHIFILDIINNDFHSKISEKITEAFPDKPRRASADFLDNYSKLSKEIRDRLRIQKALMDGDENNEEASAFFVLKELSSAIPKNVVFDIKELHINRKIVKIVKGVTNNATVVKDLLQALEKSGNFSDIKQGSIRIAVDGINKEFDISAQYKVNR